jgi:cation channel sperm-associated protein 2
MSCKINHRPEVQSETMDVDEVDNLINTIQSLLINTQVNSNEWEKTVQETMAALSSGKRREVLWPKDTLFKYLRCMESLQENMREYQELQHLANWALLDMND